MANIPDSEMDLPDAQKEFMEILHQVKNPATLKDFLSWIKVNWFADGARLDTGKILTYLKK